MTISGSHDPHALPPVNRVNAIGERESDDHFDEPKKRSRYLGRAWSETEEDLSLELPLERIHEERPSGLYADRHLLAQARTILERFSSLQEQLAQLCFYVVEADYDREIQQHIELQTQRAEIGGLIFTRGDFRRETYLIERCQELSKTPILMGNDFLQGLYFYFQAQCPIDVLRDMSEAHLCDLAKAIVSQNRKLGVQLQLVRERFFVQGSECVLGPDQIRAFGRGLREAHAIVGRERQREKIGAVQIQNPQPQFMLSHTEPVQEAFSLRTLYFHDLTQMKQEEDVEELLILAYRSSFDILLLPCNLIDLPARLAQLVARGRISPQLVERQLLKIILLKMGAFGSQFDKRS